VQEAAHEDTSNLSTCNFQCQGCGADELRCQCPGPLLSLCGSGDMKEQKDEKTLRPGAVPFQLDAAGPKRHGRGWAADSGGPAIWPRRPPSSNDAGYAYWVFRAKPRLLDRGHDRTPAGGRLVSLSGEHREEYTAR
jgi:hypothetical protein